MLISRVSVTVPICLLDDKIAITVMQCHGMGVDVLPKSQNAKQCPRISLKTSTAV